MTNTIETLLKQGMSERDCIAARFRVKLSNGLVYFASYFKGEFQQEEGILNPNLDSWSKVPASLSTQETVVEILTEIKNGKPANPDQEIELVFLGEL